MVITDDDDSDDGAEDCLNNKDYLVSWMNKHFPDITFDQRAINKEVNADVSLSLLDNMSIKFHCKSLEAVYEYEKTHDLVKIS